MTSPDANEGGVGYPVVAAVEYRNTPNNNEGGDEPANNPSKGEVPTTEGANVLPLGPPPTLPFVEPEIQPQQETDSNYWVEVN